MTSALPTLPVLLPILGAASAVVAAAIAVVHGMAASNRRH